MGRYRFIAAEKAIWSVRRMCSALRVSRAGFYAWASDTPRVYDRENTKLGVHIRAIHRRSRETYGAPRITRELREEGWTVSRKRVARLMRCAGIAGIPKKRFRGSTTDSAHDLRIAPNLLDRRFDVDLPNRVWVGDITYLPTDAGWAYLAVLIDLHSHKVVGWALDDHMRTSLVQEALNMAVRLREPLPGLVHHSDRGVLYASRSYQASLTELDATPSMSRKGNCWDNAVAESFFGTLEQELVKRKRWKDPAAAREAIADYIHAFYNTERRHSTLGDVSPATFEAAFSERQVALEKAA